MKKQDTTSRFGGRTISLQVAINTDEDLNAVAERVRAAAVGPKLRMAVVMAGILEPDAAAAIWAMTGKSVREQDPGLS